ncbi:hypothetical protein PIB30_002024 [Stylosanthes scabra]|uniref:Uncharacterized protein n=1 Tax=Stylosanthes scabra TaxID=79078 RepID=A0ABU6Q2Q6_9FABA|nr:hypothetical protein [Stylosanthes scabra]
MLGRPFLKTSGFKLTYADDIFTFSSGRTTETFQISHPPKKKDRQDDGRMRGKEEAQIGIIEALIRELLQKLREEEGLEKEEKEKETKGRCQKAIRRVLGNKKKSLDAYASNNSLRTHLVRGNKMTPRKVYPPPSCFSRRLAVLRACQARDEAGLADAAPHEDEVIDISSDSSSEQVLEYVPGEGAENKQDDEEVQEYVLGAEPMEEEEDP